MSDLKTLFAVRLKQGLAHELWTVLKLGFGLGVILGALAIAQIYVCHMDDPKKSATECLRP